MKRRIMSLLLAIVCVFGVFGLTACEEEEPTTPNNEFNLDSLWWMIPTILLAVATIAVIIVYVVKKFRKPERARANANANNEAIVEKRNKYEDYNE